MTRAQWYDDRTEEVVEFDPIEPGEVIVTDPEPVGLLGPDGEPLFRERVPFGFHGRNT